jgi:hypothetical protein
MRDDDDDWDDDYPESDSDDEVETLPCPNCGAAVYEESARCPECGHYITHDTGALSGRPLWFVLLGLAGIIAVIAALAWLG